MTIDGGGASRVRRWGLAVAMLLALAPLAGRPAAAQSTAQAPRTRNVVVIMSDGVRWQEVFRGADPALIDRKTGGVSDTAALRREFGRGSREESRTALLPFLWSVVAREGQLYGNRDEGSRAQVTNGLKFSYPGYNETLTGRPDPRIDSNDAVPNPNRTVFEWLNGEPGFAGKVAAFGTWSRFAEIFNRERSGIPVRAGWEIPFPDPATPTRSLLDQLYRTTTRLWHDVAYDSFMQEAVLDYVRERHPRVLFVGYGETDEWAHSRRYDQYLESAHRADAFHRPALGDDAGDARVPGHHHLPDHHRPWAGKRRRLDRPRREGERGGGHLDRSARAGHARGRRPELGTGDPEPDRCHRGGTAGAGLPHRGARRRASHHRGAPATLIPT